MFKVAALTAAAMLVFVVTAIVLAFKAGRAAERATRAGQDNQLHRDMARFVNSTLGGTALDTDYWASLSPKKAEEAEGLIRRYKRSIGN